MKHPPKLTDQWSSKLAFVLAATGAAVGLGNVWRFPYMAGSNGGSAFVIIYFICVIIIALPVLIAEILIGRHARLNPVDALLKTAVESGSNRFWSLLGWWGATSLILVLSFYSVVSGWCIAYLSKDISGAFQHTQAAAVNHIWQQFISNPHQLLAWHTVFMMLTMIVIILGLRNGLEKATKIMIPALYLILIILVIYGCVLGNAHQAIHFLFSFKLQKINTSVVIAAMGHAFFSLAVGAGAMLAYGAYVPQQVHIVRTAFIIVILDVIVAIFSGLAIFPLVFAYHLSPTEGPGLMFQVLPIAFAQIPGGSLIGALFFTLLIFAAWTSSINLAEPVVMILMHRLNCKRWLAALIIGVIAWTLGIGSALSFNVWHNVKLFHYFTIFDISTSLPTDIFLPIGGLGFAIFAGWVMKKTITRYELQFSRLITYDVWRLLVRTIAPIAILVIFLWTFIS